MSKNKPFVWGIMGAIGSGKSRLTKEFLAKQNLSRLMVWDCEEEYEKLALPVINNSNKLIDILSKHKTFKLAYQILSHEYKGKLDFEEYNKQEFERFCKLAKQVGNLTVVVDELKFVTKPNHAPHAWSNVSLRGRHAGLSVIGMSQRPASIDKDFLGSCTQITTFQLRYPKDMQAVADTMLEPVEKIQTLKQFQYLQKNMITGECVTVQMPW